MSQVPIPRNVFLIHFEQPSRKRYQRPYHHYLLNKHTLALITVKKGSILQLRYLDLGYQAK